jgi:hypothetical protein
MKWLAFLLTIISFVSSVRGCLGETEEELGRRYGRQRQTGTSHLPGVTIRGFFFGTFQVVVGVLNGRSAFEQYTKQDGSKISANDVAVLMNANGGGKGWIVDDKGTTSEKAKWVLDDGTMVAEWNKKAGTPLTVMTREAADLEDRTPAKK